MQFLRLPRATSNIAATTVRKPVNVLLAALALGLGACASQKPEPVPPPPPVNSVSQVLFRNEVIRIENKVPHYLSAAPLSVTALADTSVDAALMDDFAVYDDGAATSTNATARREALMRLSEVVSTLTSAYLVSGEQRYAATATEHLRAWFTDPATRVNPVELYARPAEHTDSGPHLSLPDTLHLTEVARSVKVLSAYGTLAPEEDKAIRGWFADYLAWLETARPGADNAQAPNIRNVYWSVQAAAFADLVGNEELLRSIRTEFKQRFVPQMMAADGSFPTQKAHEAPYGSSLLLLDALATLAQVASTPEDNLWRYSTADGRGMAKAMGYMLPYMLDKNRWPLEPDASNWDQWPVRQPSLAFAALAFNNKDYLQVWQPLQSDPKHYTVLRNLPVRHPLLWLAHNMPKAVELRETEPEGPEQPVKIASRS